jgi:hypothetical protein
MKKYQLMRLIMVSSMKFLRFANIGIAHLKPVFIGVRVTRSLVLFLCFVDRCLSFCPFSCGHCVVCPSSIYGF